MSDDLDKLVAGITPENVHPEIDFGPLTEAMDRAYPRLKKPEIKRDPGGDSRDMARA
jgi:hypothetical protein